jgi:CheY-like chemotaxis protein
MRSQDQRQILVADDEPNVRLMLKTALELSGYNVKEAVSGTDALEKVERNAPDLMLLDMRMPDVDGIGVLEHMRQWPPERRPRVVVLTAHGSVPLAVRAVRLGASDFLERPVTPEDLRLSVASVLDDPLPGGENGYDQVLRRAGEALGVGHLRAAESLLMMAGTITDDDPSFLNLAGMLHEGRGRIASARRFYERALEIDPEFTPASENLLRCSS